MSLSKMIFVAAVVMVFVGAILVNSQETPMTDAADLDCNRCHTCQTPTARDACLSPCFRHIVLSQTDEHYVTEAPDSILLDELATQYLPILFDHKPHAEMAGMGDNCATCHHYSPEGKIPPCRSCHPADPAEANLAQPDLKTAYHRQCLVCHNEWAHEATCDVCHRSSTDGSHTMQFVRGNFALPTVSVPVTKIYTTSHQPAPVVTFQHIEHIELFEYECVECHQHENCRYCHDQVNREGLSKPIEQVHAICTGCHDIQVDAAPDQGCAECHDSQERPAMFHTIVGDSLPAYLQHVGCDGCHPDRSPAGLEHTM